MENGTKALGKNFRLKATAYEINVTSEPSLAK